MRLSPFPRGRSRTRASRGVSSFRIAVRLESAVSLTASAVDVVPVAVAPVLCSCVMAFPAVRTDAVVHLLCFGKAEKGSHSEHLVQRLCVGSRIIPLPAAKLHLEFGSVF